MCNRHAKCRLFSFVFFCLVTHHSAVAGPAAVKLWAVNDGVRVNPVTGKLMENRTDIHKDYPAGDFRAGNPVWDARGKKINLLGARNEFVSFQLVIEVTQPVSEVDVSFTEVRNSSGTKIGGKYLQLFKEWYLPVRRASTGYEATSLGAGWYADALLPKRRANLSTGFPFMIPDLYNNISNQRNQAIWVDVFIPSERDAAPPGDYTGTLEVTWKGGKDTLQVLLSVWDFALPQESHLPGDIWNGSMKDMPVAEELLYYQLAAQHRFLPLIYAYRPKLSIKEGEVALDWKDYDKRLAPYLDGSAFTEKWGYWGPGYGIPLHHIMLPFDIEKHGNRDRAWPVALPRAGRTPEYERIWKEAARQVKEHLDLNPHWQRVQKIAFLDGLDESYFDAAYEKMVYYGKLLHDAMGRGWFKYRVDGGYSKEAMERMFPEIDLWVCHTVAFDRPKMAYFREKGVESWFYGPMVYEQERNSGCGSNTFLDLDLNINRAIGWLGWKYRSGWVEWEFDWNAYASWYEPENFKEPERIYNGSGQLIYRGIVMGYKEPIPSIRLKAQRRGLQDYEYFWLLAQKRGEQQADKLVNQVIYKNPFGEGAMRDTEIWKNNPDSWEHVRVAAGEMIAVR
jgi:glycosyl hydrolase family 123